MMTRSAAAMDEHLRVPHLRAVAGIGLTALLALSACSSDSDSEESPEEETEAADSQEGAEEEAEVVEEPEEPEVSDAPAFGDVYDDMLEAMESQESVTVTAAGEGMGLDAESFGDLGDLEDSADEVRFVITGGIDEQRTHWMMEMGGAELEMLVIEDNGYLSSETLLTVLDAEMDAEGAPDIDMDGVAESLEEGWVEVGAVYDDLHITGLLNELRPEVGEDPGEGAPDGEVGEYEGQPAWIYSDGDFEVVIAADENEPLPLAISGEEADETFDMVFSDWGSTEIPEEPSGDELISEADFDEVLMEHINM